MSYTHTRLDEAYRKQPFDKLPLSKRIELALEHIKHYPEQADLWPFQQFRMSVEELLSAAQRGIIQPTTTDKEVK